MNRREVTLNGTTFPLNGANTTSITTATYPISDIEDLVFVDTTSNLVALTLPNPASVAGRSVTVKKTNAGANGITVAAYASENIEGAAGPYTLVGSTTAARGSWTLSSDGTNWWLTEQSGAATSTATFAGKCVAGGIIDPGTGTVTNAFGGFAYVSGSSTAAIHISYTGLGASYIGIGSVNAATGWAAPDAPLCGYLHTGNGTGSIVNLDAVGGTPVTIVPFQVLIFAAPV